MAMNDEETVALIAGGHTLARRTALQMPTSTWAASEPEAPASEQGLGWKNSYGTGNGDTIITSGLEGPWTPTPTTWDNSYSETLFNYEWTHQEPRCAWQWVPTDPAAVMRFRIRMTRPNGLRQSCSRLTSRLDDPIYRTDLTALP